jgi:hypothetical protein
MWRCVFLQRDKFITGESCCFVFSSISWCVDSSHAPTPQHCSLIHHQLFRSDCGSRRHGAAALGSIKEPFFCLPLTVGTQSQRRINRKCVARCHWGFIYGTTHCLGMLLGPAELNEVGSVYVAFKARAHTQNTVLGISFLVQTA